MMFLILYILFIAYTSEYDLQWDDVLSISIDDIYRYRVLVILAFFDLISNVLLLYFANVCRTLYTSISINNIYRYRVLVILAFFDLISNVLLLYFDNVSRTLYTTELLPYLSWPLLIIANKLYWHQMY